MRAAPEMDLETRGCLVGRQLGGNENKMQKVLKVSLAINSNTITLQMAFSVRTVDHRLMWRDVKEMR